MNRRDWLKRLTLVPLIAWAVSWLDRLFPEPPYDQWPLGTTDLIEARTIHDLSAATYARWNVSVDGPPVAGKLSAEMLDQLIAAAAKG